MARGAVPVCTVEASSAKVTSLMWCEEFPTDRYPTSRTLPELATALDQNSYDIPFPYAVVTQRIEYLEDGTVQFGT